MEYVNIKKHINELIVNMIFDHNGSFASLGRILCCTKMSISNWKNGSRSPNGDQLIKILAYRSIQNKDKEGIKFIKDYFGEQLLDQLICRDKKEKEKREKKEKKIKKIKRMKGIL